MSSWRTASARNEILRELLVVQHSYGLNIDWLDRGAMLELLPDLNRDGLLGGTYSPDDGHCSTLLTSHAFYDHARLGAEFRFNEHVTGLKVEGGKVEGVATDKGEYIAPVVINAAGAWANSVHRTLGSPLHAPLSTLPITPDSHEAAITEPVARFMHPMVVDIRPVPGSTNYYFYQHYTGQIVFCITPSPSLWGEDSPRDQRLPADGGAADGGFDAAGWRTSACAAPGAASTR